ncbi:hypothetical protein ACJMK2_003899 [Sinanodonta woodiana]|uniref:EB domain-containing protein n=1 Tax=Sinanodonta woodiana TaxID=1069815 RepID=A0ABD3XZJ7_SINWO
MASVRISSVINNSYTSVIQAQQCFDINDCIPSLCGDGYTAMCASDMGDQICMCVGRSSISCTTVADCRRHTCESSRDPHEHCIDGHCRCLHHN